MAANATPSPRLTATGAPRAGGTGMIGGHPVSRIGYGAMQLRSHADRDAAIALLRRAVELGIDHVDTAQFYGDGFVNELIRDAFRPQDGVVVVSKVGADPNPGGAVALRMAQRPEELRASVEDNLTSLGLDQIPVVNLRRADTGPGLRAEGDQVVDLDDQLAVMTALRDEGKIGAIGLSSVTLDRLRRALPAGMDRLRPERLQPGGARRRGTAPALHGRADRVGAVLPTRRRRPRPAEGDRRSGYTSAARSLGCTPAQVGLAWLLHHTPNTLLIPGTANIDHLEANVAAATIALDDTAVAALNAAWSRATGVSLD